MKERAIEQDKLRSIEKPDPVKEQVVEDEVVVKKPTRMSFILPALQNHGFSDEDSDDNESLKDPNEKEEEKLEEKVVEVEETKKLDIVDEIEALEISSAPVITPPTVKTSTTEKPATYEPIPFERPYKPPVPITQTIDPEIETPTVTPSEPIITEKAPPVVEKEEKKATMEDIQKEVEMAAVAVAAVTATAATVEILTSPENQVTQEEHKEDFKSMIEHATDLNSPTTDDSGISVSKISQDDDRVRNHLAAILPAVEEAVRDVTEKQNQVPQPSKMEHQILPEDRERANRSREFEYSIEDPIDLDMFRDNVIAIQAIDPKDIPINTFKPREQEVAGKVIFLCV